MKRHGHYGITLLLYTPILYVLSLPESVLFLAVMLLFSLSPNWELSTGFATRRGIFHTVWFALVVSGIVFVFVYAFLGFVRTGFVELAWFTPKLLNPIEFGVFTAVAAFYSVITHLIGDAITTAGSKPMLRPLNPINYTPIKINVFAEQSLYNRYVFRVGIGVIVVSYLLKLGFSIQYIQT